MKTRTEIENAAWFAVAVLSVAFLVLGISHLISNWFTYLMQFVWMDLAVFFLVHVNLASWISIMFGAMGLFLLLRYS